MKRWLSLLMFVALPVFGQNVNIGTKNTTYKNAGVAEFANGTLCWREPGGGTDKACFNAQVMSGDQVITIPAITGTLATLDGTETLTNKTINGSQLVANSVALGKLAAVSTASFLGRTTAGTGDVEALNATQATALLSAVIGDSGSGGTKGLVPAPVAGDFAASKFLKADGGWTAVNVGGITGFGTGVATWLATPTGANLTSALSSGGGTSNFLRADGTFAAPAGGSGSIGDVNGPASAVNNGVALFDGTTGKLIKDGGVLATVATSGSASELGSGTLPAERLPALTGDVTSSAGSVATTLANIPTAVPVAGYMLHSNIAAPSTPASGKTSVWTDSTTKTLKAINDAGTLSTTVIADTGSSNNFLTAISAGGVISKAQPAFSSLSGSVAASQMPALTGDVTTSAGAVATTIANNAVTLGKMAQVATARFIGRTTAGTGDPEALTGTQATTMLDTFSSTLKGLAPSSGGGTSNYLRADGTWAAPAASAGGSNTQIQYNSSGSLAGSSNLTWNNSTTTLGVAGGGQTTSIYGSGNSSFLQMDPASTGVGTWLITGGKSAKVDNGTYQWMYFYMQANTEAGKRVGIGPSTTPATKLHVNGSATTEVIRVESTAAGNVGTFDIYGSGTGGFQAGSVGFNSSSNTAPILMNANGTEMQRWTSAGTSIKKGAAASAWLHIGAGTATASQAPFKIDSGTNLATAEAGTFEYNGTHYETRANAIRYTKGGRLFQSFADVGTPASSTETDLQSDTLAASTLSVNGDSVHAVYSGTFAGAVTVTPKYKVYFGGTAVYDSGDVTFGANASWVITTDCIRVSSTVVRCATQLNTSGASGATYTAYTEVTGLTLSNTQVIKMAAKSDGTGQASNDVVKKMSTVDLGTAN